ncbi:ATP-binding protein [Azotosporobacter soli]|uniref:ATP-binding protein n=1 Tax=Azotosporobacter soli TaxID=3055040 RepID=UPI0031FE518C
MKLRRHILKYLLLLVLITAALNVGINYYLGEKSVERFAGGFQEVYLKAVVENTLDYYRQHLSLVGIEDRDVRPKEVTVELPRRGATALTREATSYMTIQGDSSWLIWLEDAQGKILIGKPEKYERPQDLEPLLVQGQTVGRVGLVSRENSVLELARHLLMPLILRNLWSVLAATLAAFLIAFLFSNSLLTRIQVLADAARRIAGGELEHRVYMKNNDELADLASDFNRMAAHLQEDKQLRQQLQADVVHELRTPLAVCQAVLDSLENGVVAWDSKTLASLQEETGRMSRLVTDLHELSRAENRQLSIHKEIFALGDLLERLTESFAEVARQKEIHFAVEAPQDAKEALLYADMDRLMQIFTNLLHNAARYTPAGGSIDVTARLAAGATLAVTVADSGCGIAADVLPHVFDRFFRGDESRTRHTGGSGLGLAIAKEYALLHGGDITVDSLPGKGTSFSVTLPIEELELTSTKE